MLAAADTAPRATERARLDLATYLRVAGIPGEAVVVDDGRGLAVVLKRFNAEVLARLPQTLDGLPVAVRI